MLHIGRAARIVEPGFMVIGLALLASSGSRCAVGRPQAKIDELPRPFSGTFSFKQAYVTATAGTSPGDWISGR